MPAVRAFTPFRRQNPAKIEPAEQTAPVEQRIAHALEYIAYAMQDMNEKLDRVISKLK